MNSIKKYLVPFLTSVIVLSLNSCALPLNNSKGDNAGLPPTQAINTHLHVATLIPASAKSDNTVIGSQLLNTSSSKAIATTSSKNLVTVTIYQVDSQCQTFVPAKVALSATRPIEAAVGKVLEQQDTADFSVSGYRVSINPNSRVATVDMRVSPNSRRKFTSLSSCEQFSIFGSLRKTLTTNQAWKIKAVRFTQQGQEIYF